MDDNPKTPVGDESEEASGAEAWLERAKKVALSHRLLAALIDEEEPAEGKEEEKVSDVATIGMKGLRPLELLAGPSLAVLANYFILSGYIILLQFASKQGRDLLVAVRLLTWFALSVTGAGFRALLSPGLAFLTIVYELV